VNAETKAAVERLIQAAPELTAQQRERLAQIIEVRGTHTKPVAA
jgi:hypothetical protein